jgi:hypothetical protein
VELPGVGDCGLAEELMVGGDITERRECISRLFVVLLQLVGGEATLAHRIPEGLVGGFVLGVGGGPKMDQ